MSDYLVQTTRCRIVSAPAGRPETFDLATLSELTGLHEDLILEFARARLVEGRAGDAPGAFACDERGLLRLRQIAELHESRRVSLRALRLIVHLLDRLEATETELRELREQLR